MTHPLIDLHALVPDGFSVGQLDAESLVARSYEIGSAPDFSSQIGAATMLWQVMT